MEGFSSIGKAYVRYKLLSKIALVVDKFFSMKQEIKERFALNIARVRNLVSIYTSLLSGPGQGQRGHQATDVLRAATVLLHASLEDVRRSLAYGKLPMTSSTVLDQIPFVGGSEKNVSLGSLSVHRGKSVDDVIKASVDANLERSNSNNPNAVCKLLQSLELNIIPVQSYLVMLETAMVRRHQIVHRADANQSTGRGNHRLASINPATVDAWITNTEQFVQAVLAQV